MRFAEMLAQRGFEPERCLMVQKEGGFAAVALQGGELFLLTGPAPRRGRGLYFPPRRPRPRLCGGYIHQVEGLGGILALARRAAWASNWSWCPRRATLWRWRWSPAWAHIWRSAREKRRKNALLSVKRRRGNANVVWDFAPIEREALEGLQKRWLEIINEPGLR